MPGLSRDRCVELEGVSVQRETESAILCDIDGEEHWIPKSQIHDDSEVYKADTEGTLIVSLWIAKQKGFGS